MKKAEAFELITIDGGEYRWRLRHGAAYDTVVGLKGVSISVWRVPDRTRELILDLPFSVFGQEKAPKRNAVLPVLRPAILAAIEAGWDPDSRGRTFRFTVPETDPQPEVPRPKPD